MSADAAVRIAAVLVASVLGTLLLRRALLKRAMLDRPNERSSHSAPVPRGGGAAFVAIALIVLLDGASRGQAMPGTAAAAIGLVAVAAIGWLDDARGVRPLARLAVHLVGGAVVVLGTLEGAGWLVIPALAVAVAWMINLVNFMDGIDGIAGAQGVFVLAGAALVVAVTAPDGGAADGAAIATLLALAAAVAGFLLVNISRLKVFMGDVGSGALGLMTAWALLAAVAAGVLAPWSAAILPAAFVADATVTLGVRVMRSQHPAHAHRTHAYQRMVRRGRSHLAVTGLYSAINCSVILPAALLAALRPEMGAALAAGVYAALACAAILAGAGREP